MAANEQVVEVVRFTATGLDEITARTRVFAGEVLEAQKQQKALKKSIRELQNFSNHLYDTHIKMKFHFDAKNMAAIPMPKIKHHIHKFSVVFNSSVAGYKDFNLKYPEDLNLDCLAGL
jgi:hypothetical protein